MLHAKPKPPNRKKIRVSISPILIDGSTVISLYGFCFAYGIIPSLALAEIEYIIGIQSNLRIARQLLDLGTIGRSLIYLLIDFAETINDRCRLYRAKQKTKLDRISSCLRSRQHQ